MTDRLGLALRAGGALAAAAVLAVAGGPPGLAWAAALLACAAFLPVPLAFLVGQFGAAAVAADAGALLVAAEGALLAVLASDLTDADWQSVAAGASVAVAVAGVAWQANSISPWASVLGAVAVIAAATYAVHRYELLTTGQLTQ